MWLLRTIFDYSLGSVLLGVLVAVLLAAIFMLVAMLLDPKKRLTPVSLAATAVLAVLLLFQSVLFFGSRRVAATVDSYEDDIAALLSVAGGSLDDAYAKVRDEYPIVWHFVAGTDYEQLSLTELPHAICDDARAALRAYAWRRVWWAAGGFVLLLVLTVLLEDRSGSHYSGGSSSLGDYGFDDSSSDTSYFED